jgi:hypothetical protein
MCLLRPNCHRNLGECRKDIRVSARSADSRADRDLVRRRGLFPSSVHSFRIPLCAIRPFSDVGAGLADLSVGNGTTLFKMTETPSFQCACDPSEYLFESVAEAESAVLCNDGQRISQGYEEVLTHYHKMSQISSWADVWEPIRMACL